jgi:hypothetical protein
VPDDCAGSLQRVGAMLELEPIAGHELVKDQHGKRQQQPHSAKYGDRDETAGRGFSLRGDNRCDFCGFDHAQSPGARARAQTMGHRQAPKVQSPTTIMTGSNRMMSGDTALPSLHRG